MPESKPRIVLQRWPIIAIAAGWMISTAAVGWYELSNTTFVIVLCVALLMLGATIAAVFFAVKDWRKAGAGGAVPLIACVAAAFLSGYLAQALRGLHFRLNLPVFQNLVERAAKMRPSDPPEDGRRIDLDSTERATMEAAEVYWTPRGTLVVEVETGAGGLPAMHFGYLYTSSGDYETTPVLEGRSHYRMAPHWFRLAD